MNLLTNLWRGLPALLLLSASCTQPPAASPTLSSAKTSPALLTSASTPENLSLPVACALAVSHHPSLATYPMERRAADARILKATRCPNPQLSIDMEDFFGTGGVSGLGAAMLNTIFTQLIERGGKREARTEVARSEGAVMDAEYALRRQDLIRQTGELYIRAVAAHENLAFLKVALERSRETKGLIGELESVGRVTRSTTQQADLEVRKMELEIAAAEKELRLASQALVSQWGDRSSYLLTGSGLGSPPENLASRARLASGLQSHPALVLARAKVAHAEANLQLARAGRFQDITLFGGARRANGPDELSALGGVSGSLPIYDKGEDAVVEMTALLEAARTELAGEQRKLTNEFALAWSELVADHEATQKVRTQLLPAASDLFRSAEETFRAGKMTSLEYLAARQQFQDIRRQWLTARRDYQISATRVQALTNRSL